MTSEKERSGTLEACVSKGQSLADLVEYSEDSIVRSEERRQVQSRFFF